MFQLILVLAAVVAIADAQPDLVTASICFVRFLLQGEKVCFGDLPIPLDLLAGLLDLFQLLSVARRDFYSCGLAATDHISGIGPSSGSSRSGNPSRSSSSGKSSRSSTASPVSSAVADAAL